MAVAEEALHRGWVEPAAAAPAESAAVQLARAVAQARQPSVAGTQRRATVGGRIGTGVAVAGPPSVIPSLAVPAATVEPAGATSRAGRSSADPATPVEASSRSSRRRTDADSHHRVSVTPVDTGRKSHHHGSSSGSSGVCVCVCTVSVCPWVLCVFVVIEGFRIAGAPPASAPASASVAASAYSSPPAATTRGAADTGGWTAYIDGASGAVFYYHAATGVSSWTNPVRQTPGASAPPRFCARGCWWLTVGAIVQAHQRLRLYERQRLRRQPQAPRR